jgi:dipeptide/tripeptide permease
LIPLLIVVGIAVFIVGTFSAASGGGVDPTTFGFMALGIIVMGFGFLLLVGRRGGPEG